MEVERAKVVWKPDTLMSENSQLGKFAHFLGFGVDEYDSLHRWSIGENQVSFWAEVWDFMGLIGERGERGQVDSLEMGKQHFFPEGFINVAENMLRHDPATLALIQVDTDGEVQRRITFGELKDEVERVAAWMVYKGVKPGDVVATVSTTRSEVVVSMLASAAIGAIWTSASTDLTAQAIVDRIGQVKPVVLFVSPKYVYNYKEWDFMSTLESVGNQISSIKEVVLIGQDSIAENIKLNHANVSTWNGISTTSGITSYERFPFNAPFLILYTSGTTGKPKAIVHSGGGVLLRTGAEHRFHTGVSTGDILFQYTNISWMMFPWTVMAMESGAALVLYEDAAVKKTESGIDPSVIWKIAENTSATTVGLSPNYLKIIQREDYRPNTKHNLKNLKTMLSSGSPMPADLYHWALEHISPKLRINSVSGGTEVMGALVYGSPLHTVRAGEISCKSLGIATDIFDERGASVTARSGELVITQPFPSMPLTFWGDGGDERYKSAYFEKYAGIWTHGDLAEQTVNGGYVIHGRSDNTLKPGGVRIGTAEIYAAIEGVKGLEDAIIFGRPNNGDEEIVLCVQLTDNMNLDSVLAGELRSLVRKHTSPRHVPNSIYQVSDIPKTLNGKRIEAAVKAVIQGKDTSRFVSLANRESLLEFQNLSNRDKY